MIGKAAAGLALAVLAASMPSGATPTPAPARLITVNQLGYPADGPKIAISPGLGNEPVAWRISDFKTGEVKLSGMSEPIGFDPTSGQTVQRIDFSALRAPGAYEITTVDGRSPRFVVGTPGYGRLTRDALAYFYHNRAGTPIEARFVGEAWARPAGHAPEIATCFDGPDQRGTVWPGCKEKHDLTGGWYDAGDQGKYVVNGGITVWTLMNLQERAIVAARPGVGDGILKIPEAGNGVSDVLDEARWELEFLLKMQLPQGARATVAVGPQDWRTPPSRLEAIDAGGMAYHKVGDAKWTALPTAPHEDREPRLIYPPSTGATLNLAAVTAQCARLWKTIDPAFAARCLTASERAWAAAKRNPEIFSVGAWTGSGGYGDSGFSDEFYWAAAELYATTGKPDYAAAVRASPHFAEPVAEAGWNRVAPLGTITLALVPNGLGVNDVTRLRGAIVEAGDRFLADGARNGYGAPYAPERWPWGSTAVLANRAMLLAYAGDFTGEPRYRAGVIAAMDFLLGRNAIGVSFVSGYGAHSMQNPHHRFWAKQADARYPGPPPGALSGGPSESFADPAAQQRLKGKCTGQTCWTDDYGSFSTNEVAINWNAPLAWVAAWMAERE